MKLKFFLPFVALAALGLAACDNKPSEGNATPPATTSEPAAPAPAPATPAPDPAKPAPAN
ncbi:hypothetical protein [Candidatus Phyllobacterium onerii]|uniref:hypothetical protein n=1 Tax=Candidatus Phyllobacterium onerii TaxID=3020828 RepID=UPI00232B80E6|nr:hypothetical protein [Phyllobacterium sp. IY22]